MRAPRYHRVRLGWLEAVPASVSRGRTGLELLALLVQASSRRALPGALTLGEAALAELFDWPVATMRRRLRELVEAGLVISDAKLRQHYVLGTARIDGPRTPNAVTAMVRELWEWQPSPVRSAIIADISASLADDQYEKLRAAWERELIALSASESDAYSASNSGSEKAADNPSLPIPIPIPNPEIQNPQPQPPPDVSRYLQAVGRVGHPALSAAAAAADLSLDERQTLAALGDRWFVVLEAFASSFWMTDRGKQPPTLRRLIADEALREKLLGGEYQDGTRVPICAQCGTEHRFSAPACPEVCRGCNQRHFSDIYCSRLKVLEADEHQRAEEAARRAEARALLEREAADLGVAPETLEAQREAERRASVSAMFRQFRTGGVRAS